MSPTLPLVIALIATGALTAQIPQGWSHPASTTQIPWPSGIGNGPFMRITQGVFMEPDHHRDAIVLKGTELGHVSGAGIYDYVEALPFPVAVNDIVTLPGGNIAFPGYDAVLIVPVTGGIVTRFTWVPVTGVRVTESFAMPLWDGAKKSVAKVLPTGGTELGAVAVDGQTILRAHSAAGVTQVSAVAVGSQIRSLALGDTNGDAELETLVLLDAGVQTYSRAGVPIGGLIPANHPGGALSALGNGVAWLKRDPTNSFYRLCLVIGDPLLQADIKLNGGDFDLAGMTESNVDMSSQRDLVVSQRTTQQALSIAIEGMSPNYTVSVTKVDLTSTPQQSGAVNNCTAVAADFDGDNVDDILAPVDNVQGIALARGLAAAQAAPISNILGGSTVFVNGSQPTLYLSLDGLAQLDGFTHLQVVLWRQASSTSVVDAWRVSNEIFTIAQADPALFWQSVQVPLWSNPVFPNFLRTEVVFGTLSSTGKFLAGPTFCLAAFMDMANRDSGLPYLNSIASEPPSSARVYPPVAGTENQNPPSPGRTYIGSIMRSPIIGPYDSPPKAGTPVNNNNSTVAVPR